MGSGVSVLIVDPHPIFREGLKALLGRRPGYTVVGEAAGVAETLPLARELAPDLVLVALSLGEHSALDLISKISQMAPGVPILVLSRHRQVRHIVESFRAGARGYVTKDATPDEVLDAMDAVMEGRTFVSGAVSLEVVRALAQEGGSSVSPALPGVAAHSGLTARELEVLRYVAQGRSAKEIARELGLSPKTVENHRAHLMRKLGVHNLFGLLRSAIRMGLVDPELWE